MINLQHTKQFTIPVHVVGTVVGAPVMELQRQRVRMELEGPHNLGRLKAHCCVEGGRVDAERVVRVRVHLSHKLGNASPCREFWHDFV